MIDCSIVISTFGDPQWQNLAAQRAIPNANTFGLPVIYNHATSLHEARNAGLYQVETEFVCFLDADDELDPGFFDYMFMVNGWDIRVPSMNHVHEQVTFMPKVVGHTHDCVADCLEFGNWICVGAVARTELLKEIGGWKEWGTFEDYDLWQRAWIAGASITPVPDAVYRAYSTPQGRCKNLPVEESTAIQRKICETNLPDKDWSWLK